MNNNTAFIKTKLRLNKGASNDFDNLECWQFVEAFNKAQVSWCRRNLHGENQVQEGDEQSISRIDDLQRLIADPLQFVSFSDKGDYFQSDVSEWPAEYLRYKRIALTAVNSCCEKPKRMTVYLVEEGNVDIYLNDSNIKPDYAWGQTFATITGNKLNLYHLGQFTIDKCSLIYYREPVKIAIVGCRDPYTNAIPATEVICELPDDLVELIIDEACSIIAGDIESPFQVQRLKNDVEKNN